ncbi:serine/threonine-protein kinase [Catellatospora vulcania]|uniref:serine/threonine-protein kinase n=1 Tax=Catellatospora vulcania TaxID=1460450 RepID=UPI001E46CAB9|nr:serine/threonine-protein kinase [Catellatospora vulcania]
MTVDAGRGDGTQGTGAPAPVLHPGDPRQAGGVRLLGRLGEGGMGVVFLGQDAAGRLVAVKVIRPDYARDRRFLARFAAEAAAARRVARFCTAQVLDAGADGDLAYLVTEYIEGPTLTAALDADGPMHGSTLDSLAIGVAAALNGIHAAGVVHRDLKPGNVLLSRVGPKVIDFGIARALDHLASLTESGDIVGTPAYMAPEQFRGTATAATDVFSWGAVVTFAATGRPPFGAGAPYELMHRILTDPPDLGGLEHPLRGLVTQALDKEPERRPTARGLLLTLVGDTPDPIDTSSRILSTQWTSPPPATARIGPAPTRLDDAHAAGPLLDRPLVERAPARRARLLALAAAGLVTVVVAVMASRGWWRDTPGAVQASHSASAGHAASPSARSAAGTGAATSSAGAPTPIRIGERTPARGEVSLGVGETRTYRLHVTTGTSVSVKGHVCAELVRWQLSHEGGAPVTSGKLGCLQSGPYVLPAGEYVLVVGQPGVDGKYALTLIGG